MEHIEIWRSMRPLALMALVSDECKLLSPTEAGHFAVGA